METESTSPQGSYPGHVGYSLVNVSSPAKEAVDLESSQPFVHIQPPPHLTSLLKTVAEDISSRHLFLQGPPKSGRSSLLMDLACELAATSPCRCPPVNNGQCSCVSVAIFLPEGEADFPIHCEPEESIAAMNHMEFTSSQQQSKPSFSNRVLRRIQIRRIISVQDLLQQLWSMQGLPIHEQPSALLLDDLDRLCNGFPIEGSGIPSTHVDPIKARTRESLVVATLLDTANCLTRLQQKSNTRDQTSVFVLATSSASGEESSSALPCFVSPAFAVSKGKSSLWKTLTIRPGGSSLKAEQDEVVASRWTLQPQGRYPLAEYAVMQSLERGWRLVWTTSKNSSS